MFVCPQVQTAINTLCHVPFRSLYQAKWN